MLTPFGKLIRQYRNDRDMLLLDLAEALEKSPTFVSAVEAGRKPIPDGYVRDVIRAMDLTPVEARKLTHAADKTRREIRIDTLSEDQRMLMAALARQLDKQPDDPDMHDVLQQLRNKLLKSVQGDRPFFRKRQGMLVAPMSGEGLRDYAEQVRTLLVSDDVVEFPIIRVLEHHMGQIFRDFQFEVLDADTMGDNEGHVLPGTGILALREDVYVDACGGNGRAKFTACHELGHFLLHRDIAFARSREEGMPIYRDSEWQADRFAGALMMSVRHMSAFPNASAAAVKCGMSGAAADYQFKIHKKLEEKK